MMVVRLFVCKDEEVGMRRRHVVCADDAYITCMGADAGITLVLEVRLS